MVVPNSDEGSVCSRCIGEAALAAWIKARAIHRECSFCGRRGRRPIAIPVGDLLCYMSERIGLEYEDANNSVGWDSSEGGFLLPTMDGYDLLEEVGVEPENQELQIALARSLDDCCWVRRDPYSLPPEEVWRFSWEQFAELVKHRNRYLFFHPGEPDDLELMPPSTMLDKIGGLIAHCGLLRRFEPGMSLFRVRRHRADNCPQKTAEELGPPPAKRAIYSNRMSPAGVPMFYAALDDQTALAETLSRSGDSEDKATIAVFETTSHLVLLDLRKLPRVPSVFDPSDEASFSRPGLIFLHGFVRDLTKPVEKSGTEHVEYAPSQVVTEYVRFRLHRKAGEAVAGILYPSAVRTGVGCVLFIDSDDIRNGSAPIRLRVDLTRTIPA